MGVMSGIRVVEVAAWTYVPVAGAVLAEWGADVIKIEHPETGDPQRGLVGLGAGPHRPGGVAHMMELPNRGKRSVGLDLKTDEGRDLLLQLARHGRRVPHQLPARRPGANCGIDVEDIRAVNPDIIYVRGSGQGQRGPRPSGAATTAARSGAVAARPTSSRTRTTTRRPNPARPSAT